VFEQEASAQRQEVVLSREELLEMVETAFEILPQEDDERLLRGAMGRFRSVEKLAEAAGETLARFVNFRIFRPGA
jgi:hypothetical protein